jgi:hypothetical protein
MMALEQMEGRLRDTYQFENVCLRGIPLSGQHLVMHSLSDPPAPAKRILVPHNMTFLDGDWTEDKLLENILYVLKIGNLESGDALFVQNLILNVLQITVGEAHPAKANGLKTISKCFAHLNNINAHRLVFIVPKNGKLRRAQCITTQKGSVATKKSHIVSAFESNQWRLEYEIPVPEILIVQPYQGSRK